MVELAGLDAAAEMVRVARESAGDPRIRVQAGTAEHLPGPDGAFDLVVSTTSFDHWADQEAGLLLARAGFQAPEWHVLYAVIIGAVTASK